MIEIIPIPAFKDNYIWAIHSKGSRSIWIVDPGDALPVIRYLESHQLQLGGILVTHHHWDHAGGLPDLQERYPNTPIYGADPKQVPSITHPITEGDSISLSAWEGELAIQIMAIPGHTLDHTAYLLNDALFCGDTLFACGCGRIFEGTPSMMFHSLSKLKQLPAHTRIYCGHEYTLPNILFALKVDPQNVVLQQRYEKVHALRQTNACTLPSILSDEWLTNPFLRCDTIDVQSAVSAKTQHKMDDPLLTFAALREWKNQS
jgi:hydroxyacylglutathione hydrolase